MIAVVPFKGAAPVPIDPDWFSLWSEGFPDAYLAEAMLADEHLSERIVDVILTRMEVRGTVGPLPAGQEGRDLKTFVTMPRAPLLRMLGILWKAPVLAALLPNPEIRHKLDLQSRAKLDIVLAYRDHAPAATVGPLDAGQEFAEEGALCLYAWISRFEPSVQDRLLLTVPFCSRALEARAARYALTTRLLGDEAALETLAS